MADLLQTGVTWLKTQLREHVSRSVVYRRGQDEVTISATFGRTLLKLSDDYGGARMEWTDRDFIVTAADLVLDSETITPERGDQVRVTEDGTVTIYEVSAPGDEPVWKPFDPHGIQTRVHTKRWYAEDA